MSASTPSLVPRMSDVTMSSEASLGTGDGFRKRGRRRGRGPAFVLVPHRGRTGLPGTCLL